MSGTLADRLTPGAEGDVLLDVFVEWAAERGLDLYPAQEEAILELLAGSHVILGTPTGSGKSLVATAGHAAALASGRRSIYTAPIKALVSEKCFALVADFGADTVGMITGDAAVNPGAPIICCTAEILAHRALREGRKCDVGLVIADEFHFYADPQRGWAWQVPLLELPHTQFLLMSATLGPTETFAEDLEARTGRSVGVVADAERPVPLEFSYRDTPLHESIADLVEGNQAPIYIVHFTQKAAAEKAQDLCSLDALTKDEKADLRDELGNFRFDTPIGKDLRRFISHGIGLHHAGMLPRYRRLIEKLAQRGLLKLICGTDTLGVGVNVPIRTVLFTQLCKYDGEGTRILTVREFQQISGRAGRRGFDDLGYVWVQAPAHWIENRRADERAIAEPSRKRKVTKKRPPERGYAHWNKETFDRLVGGDPEPLDSSFDITHQMVLNVLSRAGDGGADLRRLLVDNHEPRVRQRSHIRRAIGIYRSLRDAGIVEELDEPDPRGRRFKVGVDLQDEFALHQPLSLYALEVIPELADRPSESSDGDESEQDENEHAVEVLSVLEAVLADPAVIIAAQLDRLRSELVDRLKMEGVEYEERMERLAEVEPPRPLADFLHGTFQVFREHHPWVGDEEIRPKSVAREMFETGFDFRQYVEFHGLKRSEGVVLRYLTEAFKALVQNVPKASKTEALYDLEAWLGETVRQVDSSLLDEWDALRDPTAVTVSRLSTHPGTESEPERPDVTTNQRAFRVMVRNEVFRWVRLLARRRTDDLETLAEVPAVGDQPWSSEAIAEAIAPYFEDHRELPTDARARGPAYFHLDQVAEDRWPVTQRIADPEGFDEWVLEGLVDLPSSRELGRAVVRLAAIRRL